MNKHLNRAVFQYLSRDQSALSFVQELMDQHTVYLFGGAVRDFLENSFDTIRDLDFVVEAKDNKYHSITQYIDHTKPLSIKRNKYNGYKLCFSQNITIDIWHLRDTWAFKNEFIKPSVENLLKTVFLNIDALLYSLSEKKYISQCDKNYFKIKKRKYIDIVFQTNPYENLNLLRALILKEKYGLELSDVLLSRIKEYLNKDQEQAIECLLKIQEKRYEASYLSRNYLLNVLKKT